ncbi:tripartite tricarboxylate transporter substrate-binding protein [Piscinibacter sakaiensis]|uniref:tripartite tricarboxylate transporter substrate-binding protein n=1 Tax=Piscinibacter sakaiensis TaxID=1547922 RepID=UPI003AAF7268
MFAIAGISRLLLTAALALPLAAGADYPARPITLVVPFAAGGPTDRVARDLADAMRRAMGAVSITIENVAGAGGTLAATRVARAGNDGYTLLLAHIGLSTAPALYRSLPYDTLNDFAYLGMIVEVPMTLIGRPTLPAEDFAELRTWLSQNKGRVNLANAGLGAASHLCGLIFQQSVGVNMNTVSYKGTAPALADLLAGHVDLLCDQTTNTSGQIEAGRVKVYGVTTARRLVAPSLAGLPTLDEAGLKGFNVSIWHGLYAPKETPAPVLAKLNDVLRQALQDPEFVRRQEALGAVVISDNRLEPAEHKRFVATQLRKWAEVIKAAGQYAD